MAKVPRFAEAFAGRWPSSKRTIGTATSSSISILQQPASLTESDCRGLCLEESYI